MTGTDASDRSGASGGSSLDATSAAPESRATAPSAASRRELLVGAALSLLLACLHALLIPASLRERSDLPHFLESAVRWAVDGAVPYRDIPFEYPPAALLFLRGAVELVALGLLHFEDALQLLLIPFDALALFSALLIARAAADPSWSGATPSAVGATSRFRFFAQVSARGSPQARGLASLASCWFALLLTGSLLFTRFDLAPAALLALSVALLASAPAASGAALGAATALKLYPFWAAPALAVQLWRKHKLASALLWGAVTGVAISLPAMLPAGSAAFSFLGYHSSRGVQFQSLWGSLWMVLGQLGAVKIVLVHAFGAEEIASAPPWLASIATLLSLAWILLCTNAARRLPARLVALAAICGFIAWSKIGSPQFSIALVPLAAGCLFDAPVEALAILFSIALGAWQFPFHLQELWQNQGPWAAIGLLRMLLVAGAGISLVCKRYPAAKPQP